MAVVKTKRVASADMLAAIALERDEARRDRVTWRRIASEALDMLGDLDPNAAPEALRKAVLRAQERAREILEDAPASRVGGTT